MDWSGILIGIIGLIFGVLSYMSSRTLKKKLIRDKILDIKQPWVGYQQKILNDRVTFNDNTRNQLDIKIRIEEIEGHIAILDRFADRLQKLT